MWRRQIRWMDLTGTTSVLILDLAERRQSGIRLQRWRPWLRTEIGLRHRNKSGGELRKTNGNGRGRMLQPGAIGGKLGQGVGVPAQRDGDVAAKSTEAASEATSGDVNNHKSSVPVGARGRAGPCLLQECEIPGELFSVGRNDSKQGLGLVLSLVSLAETECRQAAAYCLRWREVTVYLTGSHCLWDQQGKGEELLLLKSREPIAKTGITGPPLLC